VPATDDRGVDIETGCDRLLFGQPDGSDLWFGEDRRWHMPVVRETSGGHKQRVAAHGRGIVEFNDNLGAILADVDRRAMAANVPLRALLSRARDGR